jgi:hypothetical protein
MRRSTLTVWLAVALCLSTRIVVAQTSSAPTDSSRKFEILDNSFLVEEAFNQEAGVVQNIFAFSRDRGGRWTAVFTQEWPIAVKRHQISYTLPFSNFGASQGMNDMLVNYRYQLLEETQNHPAVAPRVSLILPTGRRADGLGNGVTGLQINVPASKQFGDLYVHANAGLTWFPGVEVEPALPDTAVHLTSPHVLGSGIWRVRPMLNLMLEAAVLFQESLDGGEVHRVPVVTFSPGFRQGWNFGNRQLVVGVALPVTRIEGSNAIAILGYFSYEFPFR